jgi:hypothetical protein
MSIRHPARRMIAIRRRYTELQKLPPEAVVKCEECGGTGLAGLQEWSDGNNTQMAWDGSYCDKCEGRGLILWIDYMTKGGDFRSVDDLDSY